MSKTLESDIRADVNVSCTNGSISAGLASAYAAASLRHERLRGNVVLHTAVPPAQHWRWLQVLVLCSPFPYVGTGVCCTNNRSPGGTSSHGSEASG